jgi:hypothetical protein
MTDPQKADMLFMVAEVVAFIERRTAELEKDPK